MAAKNKMKDINPQTKWQDLTLGGVILASGNSEDFHTGDWRTHVPKMKWENCKQCLLCTPVCPDSSIPVVDGKRQEFLFTHCKGCGICFKVCPFGAIAFGDE
jgi:pyruvate ferredoxin oxidoreductase delta subunit